MNNTLWGTLPDCFCTYTYMVRARMICTRNPRLRTKIFSHNLTPLIKKKTNDKIFLRPLQEPTSLSKKTRESNHLQMSLQRQHFGPAGVLIPRPPAQLSDVQPTEPTAGLSRDLPAWHKTCQAIKAC